MISGHGIEKINIVIHGIWNPRACKWTHLDSLRSRHLEVVGERENGHARGRHARPFFTCAHYFQAPATQATSKIEKTVIGTESPATTWTYI